MASSERLGSERIGSLLLRLSLPATVGMVVNALYNFFDTLFLGIWVGDNAIGGLTISFPIQMLVMAIGQLGGCAVVDHQEVLDGLEGAVQRPDQPQE